MQRAERVLHGWWGDPCDQRCETAIPAILLAAGDVAHSSRSSIGYSGDPRVATLLKGTFARTKPSDELAR